MKPIQFAILAFTLLPAACAAGNDGWVSLFDGKTLKGWRVAAKPEDVEKNYWTVQGAPSPAIRAAAASTIMSGCRATASMATST